eukprot:gene1762-4877_t
MDDVTESSPQQRVALQSDSVVSTFSLPAPFAIFRFRWTTSQKNGVVKPLSSEIKASIMSSTWEDIAHKLLRELMQFPQCAPFINPVSTTECPDYLDVVLQPICLRELQSKLEHQKYTCLQDFYDDGIRIFENSRLYNTDKSSKIYNLTSFYYNVFQNMYKDFLLICSDVPRPTRHIRRVKSCSLGEHTESKQNQGTFKGLSDIVAAWSRATDSNIVAEKRRCHRNTVVDQTQNDGILNSNEGTSLANEGCMLLAERMDTDSEQHHTNVTGMRASLESSRSQKVNSQEHSCKKIKLAKSPTCRHKQSCKKANQILVSERKQPHQQAVKQPTAVEMFSAADRLIASSQPMKTQILPKQYSQTPLLPHSLISSSESADTKNGNPQAVRSEEEVNTLIDKPWCIEHGAHIENGHLKSNKNYNHTQDNLLRAIDNPENTLPAESESPDQRKRRHTLKRSLTVTHSRPAGIPAWVDINDLPMRSTIQEKQRRREKRRQQLEAWSRHVAEEKRILRKLRRDERRKCSRDIDSPEVGYGSEMESTKEGNITNFAKASKVSFCDKVIIHSFSSTQDDQYSTLFAAHDHPKTIQPKPENAPST